MSIARPAALLLALFTVAPATTLAAVPIRVVEDSLLVPDGLDPAQALEAVEELGAIFELYEPVVPWIPGVKLDLEKQLLSAEGPLIMEMPVEGAAFGRTIDERARVTARTEPIACGDLQGVRIDLEFDASSPNIERRIDRIEIVACPRIADDGTVYIDATGSLYEGYLPRDPALNAFNENVGAKALQTAFLKQVPAVFDAVEHHWAGMI